MGEREEGGGEAIARLRARSDIVSEISIANLGARCHQTSGHLARSQIAKANSTSRSGGNKVDRSKNVQNGQKQSKKSRG